MKKYCLLTLSLLLFFTIAGWLFFKGIYASSKEEYGQGYSEEQRKLWNEKRALFPFWLLLDDVTARDSTRWAFAAGIEESDRVAMWKAKKQKEQELDQYLAKNRDREKRDWDPSILTGKISPEVPLDGRPFTEILLKAEAGDPDACLCLCKSIGLMTGMLGKSWIELNQINKFLDKAVSAKRPGVLFLKNYASILREKQLAQYRQYDKFLKEPFPDMDKVSGYDEFKKTLQEGDIHPFLILDGFISTREDYLEKAIVYQTLLKKAEEGDSQAQLNAALVFFNYRLRYMRYADLMVYNERKASWEQHTEWMSEGLQDYTRKLFYRNNIFSPEDSSTWMEYTKVSGYCRNLAEKGNLTAMYLWLRYGMTTLDHFSRQDWENTFKYSNQLLKSGYVPYIFDIKRLLKENFSLHHCILNSYYTPASLDKMYAACLSLSNKYYTEPRERFTNGNNDNIDELILRSDQGDPIAQFTLADYYAKGKKVAKNPEKANTLLQKALEESSNYPLLKINYQLENIRYLYMPFQRATKLSLVFLATDNPPFPGRDEKQIYEIVQSFRNLNMPFSEMGPYCLALGKVYEAGIGIQPNLKRALYFYERCSGRINGIKRHPACEREWKRLSAQLKKQGNVPKS